jgi:Protein of unknown function (DUF1353)
MTPGFQNNPALRWVSEEGPIAQVLVEPLVYVTVAGETITIPVGFVTDYASIPRIFWNILPPDGDARFPAILHDYLYSLRGWAPCFKTRKACDDLFLEAMCHVGVPAVERITIWAAVRLFGWAFSFRKNAEGRNWK